MNEMFIDVAGSILADIRVLIEGAVTLYEDDAAVLNNLARDNDMLNAVGAFDAIGIALYGIHKNIISFHEAYQREILRQKQ